MDLTKDIQSAIDFIENDLTEDHSIVSIAQRAHLSPFYFQKIFSALCGLSVGEYIRCRKLSLAAEELSGGEVKVIDTAFKYGYDSPDSFSRAFLKFHGILPSSAKEKGANIKAFAPIKINSIMKGVSIMEYKIVEKSAFTIMGVCRRFNAETSYTEIPKFWDEHYENGGDKIIQGMFGFCADGDGKSFDYFIADMYLPWKDIPDGCVTKTVDAGSWAVFPWSGECPNALQDVNTKIWKEWLPNCKEYELACNYNLEVYLSMEHGEIWIPVKKK